MNPSERTYGSSPISNGGRRSRADMEVIRQALYQVLSADHPMTVRQVFYRLVSDGAIEKTESEYKHTVVRLLTEMRRERRIPFGWLADSTRWMRKPDSYSSMESALQHTKEAYRRSLWDSQDSYVEIWLEKDALAGVLYDVTEEWDVPLMVTRGYASVSFLYSAAEAIAARGKPAYLYYFGDYDPSGLDITRAVEKGIREYAPDAEIHFYRVAVTPAQIAELGLQTRPTKASDSRSKGFDSESVEVDAIPSSTLRNLVRHCIARHIDDGELERIGRVEAAEREGLDHFLAWYRRWGAA